MTVKKKFRGRVSMELGPVTVHNVGQLKKVNSVVFPVAYNEKFYKEVVNSAELARLAYFNDTVVGGVCCRIDTPNANANTNTGTANCSATANANAENVPPATGGETVGSTVADANVEAGGPTQMGQSTCDGKRVYIMTLGCLAPYRRLGLGRLMLQHVLDLCQRHGDIAAVWLHVQVNNQDALDFYQSFGFKITATVQNYYKRIEPPDAFILQKDLTENVAAENGVKSQE